MSLKLTDKFKKTGQPKLSLSEFFSHRESNEDNNCHEIAEELQEIMPEEEIRHAKELAASEHKLQEKVGEFLSKNSSKLKKWYSDNQVNDKLGKVAKKAGATVIYPVLLLYNLLKSPDVNSKDKMLIIAPLAYFVLPADLIPDFILGLGYADDGIAVMTCIKTLSSSITSEISEQTRTMCKDLIGDVDEDVINNVTNTLNDNQDRIVAFASKKYQEKKFKRNK